MFKNGCTAGHLPHLTGLPVGDETERKKKREPNRIFRTPKEVEITDLSLHGDVVHCYVKLIWNMDLLCGRSQPPTKVAVWPEWSLVGS